MVLILLLDQNLELKNLKYLQEKKVLTLLMTPMENPLRIQQLKVLQLFLIQIMTLQILTLRQLFQDQEVLKVFRVTALQTKLMKAVPIFLCMLTPS